MATDIKEPYLEKFIIDTTSYPTLEFDYYVGVSVVSPSGKTEPAEVDNINKFLNLYNNGASLSKNNHISFKAAFKLLEAGLPLVICRASSGNIVRGITNLGDEYYANSITDVVYQHMFELAMNNEKAFLGSWISINTKKEYRTEDNFDTYWKDLAKKVKLVVYPDKIVFTTKDNIQFSPQYKLIDSNNVDNVVLTLGNKLDRNNILNYNGLSIYNKGVSNWNFEYLYKGLQLFVYDEKDTLSDCEYMIAYLDTINNNFYAKKPLVSLRGSASYTLDAGITITENKTNLKVEGQKITYTIDKDEEMENPSLQFTKNGQKYYIGPYKANLDKDVIAKEINVKTSGQFLLAILKILKDEINAIPDNSIVDYREGLELLEGQVYIYEGKYYLTVYSYYSGEKPNVDDAKEVEMSAFTMKSYVTDNLFSKDSKFYRVLSDAVVNVRTIEPKTPEDEQKYSIGQVLEKDTKFYEVIKEFTYDDVSTVITDVAKEITFPEFDLTKQYKTNDYYTFDGVKYKVLISFSFNVQELTKHTFEAVPTTTTEEAFAIEFDTNLLTSYVWDAPEITSSIETTGTYTIENPAITELKIDQTLVDATSGTTYYCGSKPFGDKLVNVGSKMTIIDFMSSVVNNWEANSQGVGIYEGGKLKIFNTSKLQNITYAFGQYSWDLNYTYKNYDNCYFGVSLKFPTSGADIWFEYSKNVEDEDDIDITFHYNNLDPITYTFSMLEEKLNGYGVDITYSNINNDYFKIIKFGGSDRLDSFTSNPFPDVVINPTAMDIGAAYEKLAAKEEYQYNMIYDCANAGAVIAQKMVALSNRLLVLTPISAIPGLDTIDKVLQYKEAIGITTCYQWFCPDTFNMSFGEFQEEMPASLLYMLQLNTNRLQRKEFTPIYGSTNAFSFRPVHLWESKEDRETLLSMRVNTIKYNPKNKNYYFNQNITMQPVKTYMSDEYVVRLITSIVRIAGLILDTYDVAINDKITRDKLIAQVSAAVDLEVPPNSYRKIQYICDETNNPTSVIEAETLIFEAGVVPNRYSKYRKVYGKVLSLSAESGNAVGSV